MFLTDLVDAHAGLLRDRGLRRFDRRRQSSANKRNEPDRSHEPNELPRYVNASRASENGASYDERAAESQSSASGRPNIAHCNRAESRDAITRRANEVDTRHGLRDLRIGASKLPATFLRGFAVSCHSTLGERGDRLHASTQGG